jgi:hypothetical protein
VRTGLAIIAALLVIVGIVLYVETRYAPSPAAPPVRVVRDAPVQDAPVDVVAVRAGDASALDAAFQPAALEALRNSGTASEVWVPDATRLVHTIAPDATVECYVAGCGAELSFSSEAAYRDAIRVIAEDRTWTGGKTWTDAARGGGRITVALILYRPD